MNVTALTIGPVFKTLKLAGQTRELWGASMLFSYVMGSIVETARANAMVDNIEIVLPEAPDSPKNPSHIGTGIVSDRFIFKTAGDNGLDLMKKYVTEALQKVGEEVGTDVNGFAAFLKRYVNTYSVTAVPDRSAGQQENSVKTVSALLNTLEAMEFTISAADYKILDTFLSKVPGIKTFAKFFPTDEKGFDTIPLIAFAEIRNNQSRRSFYNKLISDANIQESMTRAQKNRLIRELDVVKTWKENYPKEDFPSSHKYICIINADGDAIGTLLSEVPEAALPALSKALSNFGRMAESLINEYGGLPVYIGGDDLFFFAPYRNVNSSAQNTSTDVKGDCNNIFLLLDELNRQLVLSIKQFCIDNHLKTSLDDKHIGLTFGLSVTYHKFPMDEAIEISRNLMRVGKRIEWNKTVMVNNVVRNIKIKNNLKVSLMLHSGTFFTATFNLDKDRREPFRALLQLLDQYITKKEDVDLKSVIDTLLRNGTILKLLLSEKNAKQRISNFFKNNFDEEEHQKFNEFFETVTDCLMAAKDNAVKLGYSDDWVLDQTYDALRLARFVNQTDDHE